MIRKNGPPRPHPGIFKTLFLLNSPEFSTIHATNPKNHRNLNNQPKQQHSGTIMCPVFIQCPVPVSMNQAVKGGAVPKVYHLTRTSEVSRDPAPGLPSPRESMRSARAGERGLFLFGPLGTVPAKIGRPCIGIHDKKHL
jgi:hypothetical protein